MLKRSADRKVSPVIRNGRAKLANSFGLPSGLEFSCPGATPACLKVCYAGRTEKMYPSARKLVMHNWALVKDADRETCGQLLGQMISEFVADANKLNAEKIFRIHWDGDFFGHAYTEAWISVIHGSPDVQFWTYTRNANAAMQLQSAIASLGLTNLSLYFSADEHNSETAKALANFGVKIATMSDTFADARMLAKSIDGKNGIACPEQRGFVQLEGACAQCRLCIEGSNNIRFSVRKK